MLDVHAGDILDVVFVDHAVCELLCTSSVLTQRVDKVFVAVERQTFMAGLANGRDFSAFDTEDSCADNIPLPCAELVLLKLFQLFLGEILERADVEQLLEDFFTALAAAKHTHGI